MSVKAWIRFDNGFILEFCPSKKRSTFSQKELKKLQEFAKQRSGELVIEKQMEERPKEVVNVKPFRPVICDASLVYSTQCTPKYSRADFSMSISSLASLSC